MVKRMMNIFLQIKSLDCMLGSTLMRRYSDSFAKYSNILAEVNNWSALSNSRQGYEDLANQWSREISIKFLRKWIWIAMDLLISKLFFRPYCRTDFYRIYTKISVLKRQLKEIGQHPFVYLRLAVCQELWIVERRAINKIIRVRRSCHRNERSIIGSFFIGDICSCWESERLLYHLFWLNLSSNLIL
jgi:hypothetical protein